MALISSFERDNLTNPALHKEVAAKLYVFGGGRDGPVVQINTYGSPNREMPGKVSQSMQLNRKSAEELWSLLGQEYGFK